MSLLPSSKMRIISVAVFLLGLTTAMLAYTLNRPYKPEPLVGFTLVSKQTSTPSDGSPPRTGFTKVRHQRSDGSWHQENRYSSPDGKFAKEEVAIGLVGNGVYEVDRKNRLLHYLSPMSPEAVGITADLRKDEHYVRDETVLGYETRVLRFPNDDGSGYTERFYAPALQGVALKTISVAEGGTSVTEAAEIKLGEPARSEFSLPDWPVRYDRYEQKIEQLEDSGNRETAEQMRQFLEQKRQNKPDR